MTSRPESWRAHRCHDCGKRTSRSRCADCRKAKKIEEQIGNSTRLQRRALRQAKASGRHIDTEKGVS